MRIHIKMQQFLQHPILKRSFLHIWLLLVCLICFSFLFHYLMDSGWIIAIIKSNSYTVLRHIIVLILFRDLQLLYFIVLAAVRVRIACCSSNLLVFVTIGCYLCKVLLDLQLKSVSFLDLINVAYCKLPKTSLLAE